MKLAILGVGLMGGSLGQAARALDGVHVTAYARRAETREQALRMGVADEVTATPQAACTGADVAVFCTPVLRIPELAAQCLDALPKHAVLTDVGSTKACVAEAMDELLAGHPVRFVGSHPMAGSERSGVCAARPDLYRDATIVVTPSASSSDDAEARVRDLWQAVGGNVLRMSPVEHDRIVAQTSHLPHLLAAALATHVLDGAPDTVLRLCGRGFRDTTRIAAGPEDVWHDIFRTNVHLVEEVDRMIKGLEAVREQLASGQGDAVREALATARRLRTSLHVAQGGME